MFKFGGAVASDRGPMLDQEGDLIYELEQKLPVFGLPRLEREQALAEEAGALLQTDFEIQALRRTLALQLFQTALLQRQVELTQNDVQWLETLVDDAVERVRNGLASAVDVLRARNERDRRATRGQIEKNELAAAHARLNRILNRDAQAPWPPLMLPPLMQPVAYSEQLVALALNYEPRLKVMRQEAKVAGVSARLAHRRRLPEVVASVEGRQYSGDGGFREGMFKMGLTLPWFNQAKYRAEREREEARRRALSAGAEDYELEVREEIVRLTAAIDSARREAVLYRDTVLPRTRQVIDTLRNNWLGGRALLTDLLEARRELLEAEVMWARAVAGQYRMLSELVLCCGLGDLGALERLGILPEQESASVPTP